MLNADGTENTEETFIGNVNPYRYRGYYFDTETGLYFLQTRYYDPEICRFISSDDVAYIDPETIGGVNLFAYCNNNPVMNSDPYGNDWNSFWKGVRDWFSKNLATVVDIAITAVAGVAAIASGLTGGPLAAVSTFGSINNAVNSIYYNYISDGISSVTPTSYQNGYVNRWERLDYTKSIMTENNISTRYDMNAWRYYSEYNVHMYGWALTGWALDKNLGVISDIAEKTKRADVFVNKPDNRWYVNLLTVLTGTLGM